MTGGPPIRPHRPSSDIPFLALVGGLGGAYVLFILLLIAAMVVSCEWESFLRILGEEEIRYATRLSLISCTVSALLSVWIAVPIGYLMSRFAFPGKTLIDGILDIPIVLPPLVVGIGLLILFNLWPFDTIADRVVFEIPAVILAQFSVACAFAVRTLRVAFDQIPQRFEKVALTLGASRAQAFTSVILPQAWRGIVAAFVLAWARSLGEFGPILVFAGSTRLRTEVLPTSVYLEMQSGNLQGMLAVSLLMILCALVALLLARLLGLRAEAV